MSTIIEAKQHLGAQFRNEQGFVGVGIASVDGCQSLRVLVTDAALPVARQIRRLGNFEGFPVVIEVSGEIRVV
jgi:hypothetical protein